MRDSGEYLIRFTGSHPAVRLAAGELAKYLELKQGRRWLAEASEVFQSDTDADIWIGTGDHLPRVPLPAVKDPFRDDAVLIDSERTPIIISGTNPRSVLIAVYRFLHELGCRWVHPGPDGERIPSRETFSETLFRSVRISEAASYRHRGICIEGAAGFEHVRGIIDWAPKIGFNSYFIQFREAYTFFDRWYSHRDNPLSGPEPFSLERARELAGRAEDEIKRRDLLYHAVGHGWTCEPFGVPGLGWDYPAGDPPPAIRPYLAEIDGRRDYFHGVPLNTNLCCSNPEVRRILVDAVVDYAAAHPRIDYLDFSLADGWNNTCECPECRKARPADFLVMMLNDMDDLLMERGLSTRIDFPVYVDLLWPPEKERIRNPDRFTLIFSPITRTYSRSYSEVPATQGIPPYVKNHLDFPKDPDGNTAFLSAWKEVFAGDCIDFEYHYLWDHYKDPGYTDIVQVLHQDIRSLEALGIDGWMSCQTQRAFFPNGLGACVTGWSLWNRDRQLEEMSRDYFENTYGSEGERCRGYLKELSRLFDPVYLRGEKPEGDAEAAERLSRIPGVVAGFEAVIRRNASSDDEGESWRLLAHHADIVTALSKALRARAEGDESLSLELWDRLKTDLWRREEELHPVFDVWLFQSSAGRKWFKGR